MPKAWHVLSIVVILDACATRHRGDLVAVLRFSTFLFVPIDMALVYDSLDAESAALIARLTLDDIAEIESRRKNKGRADAPVSDEQLALRIQEESLQSVLASLDDLRLAKSIDDALLTDRSYLAALSVVDRAAEDDHAAALALSRDEPLPPPSQAQRALEILRHPTPSPSFQEAEEMPALPIAQRSSQMFAGHPRVGPINVHKRLKHECAVCFDSFNAFTTILAPCGHHYCRGCLTDLAEASIRDETLFPPRCCKQNFPIEDVIRHLSSQLRPLFRAKQQEFGTPPDDRIYCPLQTCSAFLGPSDQFQREIICDHCQTTVCSSCKGTAHPFEACTENAATLAVKELARENQWATCPGCRRIIELTQGCYHITCRCRTEFCYVCAERWKTCPCPQWNEDLLIDAAERRVVVQFGADAPAALHAERVRQQIDEYRVRHECANHRWRYRDGGGDCTECGNYLNKFLLRCQYCYMLACVRCTRNRL